MSFKGITSYIAYNPSGKVFGLGLEDNEQSIVVGLNPYIGFVVYPDNGFDSISGSNFKKTKIKTNSQKDIELILNKKVFSRICRYFFSSQSNIKPKNDLEQAIILSQEELLVESMKIINIHNRSENVFSQVYDFLTNLNNVSKYFVGYNFKTQQRYGIISSNGLMNVDQANQAYILYTIDKMMQRDSLFNNRETIATQTIIGDEAIEYFSKAQNVITV